jgi:hypothetical protein
MRIIGEFDSENVKVTVFSMNGRISVKFERDLMEQTYKFRDGSPIRTLVDVQQYCSLETMTSINHIFGQMHEVRGAALQSMISAADNSFEFIL